MTTWCNSDEWHIKRCAILFHVQLDKSSPDLESGSCVNRVRLISVSWLPRGTCQLDVSTKLIEHVMHHWLPACQDPVAIDVVQAEKLQRPSSELLQVVDTNFEYQQQPTCSSCLITHHVVAWKSVWPICLQKDRSQIIIAEESYQRPSSEHGQKRKFQH